MERLMVAAKTAALYFLKQDGPRCFTIRSDSRSFKIHLKPFWCTSCGEKKCIHVLFVLLRVLKLDDTHPLVTAPVATEHELDEVLDAYIQDRTRQRQKRVDAMRIGEADAIGTVTDGKGGDDTDYDCPICLLPLVEGVCVSSCPECLYALHVHCATIWTESQHHDDITPSCPLCRASWNNVETTALVPRLRTEHPASTIVGKSVKAGLAMATSDTSGDATLAARSCPGYARSWIDAFGAEVVSGLLSDKWRRRAATLESLAADTARLQAAPRQALKVVARLSGDPILIVFRASLQLLRHIPHPTRAKAALHVALAHLAWRCHEQRPRFLKWCYNTVSMGVANLQFSARDVLLALLHPPVNALTVDTRSWKWMLGSAKLFLALGEDYPHWFTGTPPHELEAFVRTRVLFGHKRVNDVARALGAWLVAQPQKQRGGGGGDEGDGVDGRGGDTNAAASVAAAATTATGTAAQGNSSSRSAGTARGGDGDEVACCAARGESNTPTACSAAATTATAAGSDQRKAVGREQGANQQSNDADGADVKKEGIELSPCPTITATAAGSTSSSGSGNGESECGCCVCCGLFSDDDAWSAEVVLGRGSAGTVFMARCTGSGAPFAVKQVDIQSAKTGDVKRLHAEVAIMKRLPRHENVVAYYGSAETPRSISIVMELLPGGSLADKVADLGALPRQVVRGYAADITKGLGFLHSHGIAHRDLKGANLLLTGKDRVKVCDFGLSVVLADVATKTNELQGSVGTPAFMAPEVIVGAGVSRRSDCWSLGCCLVEMWSGKAPWAEAALPNHFALMFMIASNSATPALPAHMEDDARDFASCCLVRNVKQRWTSAQLLQHPYLATQQQQQQQQQGEEEGEEEAKNNTVSALACVCTGSSGVGSDGDEGTVVSKEDDGSVNSRSSSSSSSSDPDEGNVSREIALAAETSTTDDSGDVATHRALGSRAHLAYHGAVAAGDTTGQHSSSGSDHGREDGDDDEDDDDRDDDDDDGGDGECAVVECDRQQIHRRRRHDHIGSADDVCKQKQGTTTTTTASTTTHRARSASHPRATTAEQILPLKHTALGQARKASKAATPTSRQQGSPLQEMPAKRSCAIRARLQRSASAALLSPAFPPRQSPEDTPAMASTQVPLRKDASARTPSTDTGHSVPTASKLAVSTSPPRANAGCMRRSVVPCAKRTSPVATKNENSNSSSSSSSARTTTFCAEAATALAPPSPAESPSPSLLRAAFSPSKSSLPSSTAPAAIGRQYTASQQSRQPRQSRIPALRRSPASTR